MRTTIACNRVVWLLGVVAVVTAPCVPCAGQQVGSVDLTQITPRMELRRPPARPADTTGLHGGEYHDGDCPQNKTGPTVQTTLVGLDRSEYEEGDEPKFEVRITNLGSSPIKIPFSPHLADLQPQDASAKFAYSVLTIELWIVAGRAWSANTGGTIRLYGSDDHPGTILALQPGEWAEVIGTGEITFPDSISPLARARNPVIGINAKITIEQDESLFTATDGATVAKRVCLNYTQGPIVPVKIREATSE